MVHSIKPASINELILLMRAKKILECTLCHKAFISEFGSEEKDFAEKLSEDGFKNVMINNELHLCCPSCVEELNNDQ